MKPLFKRTNLNKKIFFLFFDAFFIILSFYLAFFLRFDGEIPSHYFKGVFQEMIIIALFYCLPLFNAFGLYDFSWSYVSTEEMFSLFKSLFIGFFLNAFSLLLFREWGIIESFPRSTLIIGYFLIFLLSGGLRISKRLILDFSDKRKKGSRTLIVGAGDAGEQILRSIRKNKEQPYHLVGFIDDNPSKKNILIHGVPVLGRIDDIPKISASYNIQEMIIALPSTGSEPVRRAVEKGREAGIKRIKIVPAITEIMSGEINLGNLREVNAEDLLGREPIEIDTRAIEKFIKGKKIIITGAAGSIGSELCRQVARFHPSLLLMIDQDETGIFNISNEIKNKFSSLNFKSIIADIVDQEKINRIFSQFKPDIVFHAAAYKHVPLMEENFEEAVKNNVFGTKIVAQAALENKAEKFIFISTDKAVKPSSIMGATKRIGEMITQSLNEKNSTRFIAVRFGNVLDSRGSVIPVFREKIKKREAIEITHPEMKRYFMMIREACLLVMQSAQMGKGGEVFVLDMGNPIKILDLAKEMIRLAGLEPDKDIPIVFSGIRPGEKLFEEILTAEEGVSATQNQKIFIAKLSQPQPQELEQSLNQLKEAKTKEELLALIKKIIPSFKASN